MSERRIVEMYGFAKTTVHMVIKNFEERGLTKPAPRSRRPQKLSENYKSLLVEIVEENHLASLSEITAQMRDITLDDVSESTIRRALHVAGTLDMLEQGSPSSARSIVKNVLTGH